MVAPVEPNEEQADNVSAGLRYTGHPLVDAGVATITAFSHKLEPGKVTLEDLDEIAGYIEKHYPEKPMSSFISVVFTNASDYIQPAFSKFPEKRKSRIRELVYGHRHDHPITGRQCVFCGRPGVRVVFRQHVPMFGGETVFNFYPEGSLGLPVCALCMLAIQAFPLGSTKCNGRALIVHSDCPDVNQIFAGRFLEKNLAYLQTAGLEKMPDTHFPKTLLIETMLSIEEMRLRINDRQPCSITAYHLTNYGTNADVDIYPMPLGVMSFILAANNPTYKPAWNALVARGWELPKTKAGADSPDDQEKGEGHTRNFLYEDLFALPDGAPRFLRSYFLRRPLKRAFKTDPRQNYALSTDLGLISWPLTTLFLERVMNMDRTRITAIERLADRLADYAINQDNRFFVQIHQVRRPADLRLRLINADIASVKAGRSPLITFQDFLEVFEEGEDVPRPDWSLARDLVVIRMIERMYAAGVFQKHPELAQQASEDSQTQLEDDEK